MKVIYTSALCFGFFLTLYFVSFGGLVCVVAADGGDLVVRTSCSTGLSNRAMKSDTSI